MDMPNRSSTRRDVNQLAKAIVDASVDGSSTALPTNADGKNIAAMMLGRLGGLKGGRARAQKMSASRRKEIAQKAAMTRWSNRDNNNE